ncbi:MAG: hypothetical protein C0619_04245 [Desulfuromonas sp.]|nr:MAG: hypothetical protein C0619_04245 [Desulfuromonas sp.]
MRTIYAQALVLAIFSFSFAADFNVTSETLFRSFERDTKSGSDELVLPGYEYLKLDVDRITNQSLSFHAYGWVRHDFSDSSYYPEESDGELIYAYLEYAGPKHNQSLRLGRQHVFSGVANDALDGLSFTSDLGDLFSVSAYGGLPVGLADTAGQSGDVLWGGRLAHHYRSFYNIGLSYQKVDNDDSAVTSKVGIDSAFLLPMNVGLYGNSVRNMETEGWAEHVYWLHLLVGNFSIRPYYEMFEYDDYFDAGALSGGPFASLAHSGETLDSLGLDLSWQQSPDWTFGAKAKSYSYEVNETSNFLSLSATWSGDYLTRVGGELGKMKGDAADNDYLLVRLFFYLDHLADKLWVDFVSGDGLYTGYDQEIYGQDYAYFASLGAGKTFIDDALQIKLSADYSKDPYFDNDLRSMLTVTCRFGAGQ